MDAPLPPPSRSHKTSYLLTYNALSTLLWFTILARTALLLPLVPPSHIHGAVSSFAKYTQSLAVLEILHSALGIIRSPLPTTALQVASRLFVIWVVVEPFYAVTAPSAFYVSMLLAWSLSEVVRYGYFALALNGGVPGFEGYGVPRWLSWARYNTFYVLYPVGIGSECVLIWKASKEAERLVVRAGYWAVLAVYVPGSYVLYTHMIKQKRKAVRGKAPERRG